MTLLMGWTLLGAQPKGTLIIAGGGNLPLEVFQVFARACGGAGATVAIVPTASAAPDDSFHATRTRLEALGLHVVRLDVQRREEASLADRLAMARTCSGFWFTGGDQKRIHDRLVGTPLHHLLLERFADGATLGGTSAGAAMMSEIMIEGTDDLSELGRGAYRTLPGLGFLREAIVDQHFLRRSRHNRLLSLALEHPTLLMIGIDEETAIIFAAGAFSVVGQRKVLLIDPRKAQVQGDHARGMEVHLLGAGETFHLQTTGGPLRKEGHTP